MIPQMPELDRAWALLGQNRFVEARDVAGEILRRFPNNVSALACHAMANWQADGDMAVSLEEMRRATQMAPDVAPIRHNLATLLMSDGQIDAATDQFREALRIKPDDTIAFQSLVQNVKFAEETELVRAMVALHAAENLDAARREYLSYGLAKVFDDLNQPDKAMAYAIEANRLGARPFDLAGEEAALDELKELGQLSAFRRARSTGHPTRAPLFIVGMPRAGTTLVETILARHPDVLALGETTQIVEVEWAGFQRGYATTQRRGRHEMTLALDRDWLAARAEAMVKGWTARAKGPFAIATDKLPENALRLGLVARLFPHARVIHVRRHPLDTGVSNFFQRFSDGQGFSNRLDWIGRRVRETADSMEVWKRALDLPILDVSYERLVSEPETQARRMAEFAGLEWTDAMLAPEQARRTVLTASVVQVRQPIYTSAVHRWRRYEPWLGPMIEAMGGMGWVEAETQAMSGQGA
jgi:tetratricopeptide (TPR) repeat protein